jgi:DNA-binding NtrC family response regulator
MLLAEGNREMSAKIALNVLLVDDDENICRTLSLSLRDLNCTVVQAHSVPEALSRARQNHFDLILTDYRMEGQSGLDLIHEIRRTDPHVIIVVMTAFASFENVVAVVREGAFDYLPKPFTTLQLSHLLQKIRVLVQLKRENSELRNAKGRRDYFAGMTSPASRRLEEFIRKVSPTDATVLLVGESGTGKSELARCIHDWSPRAQNQFVTVQCTSLAESLLESELFGHRKGAFTGAISDKKGKLELADGGTLFLDEIGDLPLAGQSKLLRFLQEKVFERVGSNDEISVDTRIIVATNKNLEEAVTQGKFRDDLYYRLNILESVLTPLRFRREDLPVLVQRLWQETLSKRLASVERLSDSFVKVLVNYSWPGNLRELGNALERVAMLAEGREPQLSDLPEAVCRKPEGRARANGPVISLEELERDHIRYALSVETNLERVAEMLGITTVTLWRKRKEYGLS